MTRLRPLVSPLTRADIVGTLALTGKWHGRRAGVKMEFFTFKTIGKDENPIQWRARIDKVWRNGSSPTVFDAVLEIERQAAL